MNVRALVFVFALSVCAACHRAVEPAADEAADAHVVRSGRELQVAIETQRELGLVDAALAPAQFTEEIAVFGRVREDPAASFTLRAPVAGTWRTTADSLAPELGAHVAEHADFGWIEPRLTPAERADASSRLATARAELGAALAAVDASARELERARLLNADDKGVSDRALETARALAAADSARAEGAQATIAALEALLAQNDMPRSTFALRVERAGELVEIGARPGEAVEAGALLVRVADLSRPLVRLELPFGIDATQLAPRARITGAFDGALSVQANLVGASTDSESRSAALALVYRCAATSAAATHRPGQSVRAWIPRTVGAAAGFVVPRSAVVRLAGRSWVWRRAGAETFERVEIALDRPLAESWFTDAEWASDARVVVTGAQALLSAELLAAEGRPEESD